MTTAKKADRRAEETGSGKGGVSNEAGPAAGTGRLAENEPRHDNQRDIGGTGSPKSDGGRPGHKANA
ncbi:hypothetical protein [Muricoccus aerilatus]|uniref:hypothetical protein n=1 Tax=Muricoccus aerilatus TaxID=452982 RepID=UPI0005C144AF|nr:hypothetical protein [Roseomonas aerilata]